MIALGSGFFVPSALSSSSRSVGFLVSADSSRGFAPPPHRGHVVDGTTRSGVHFEGRRRRPPPPTGPPHLFPRLWSCADKVCLCLCGLIGARFAFALEGSTAARGIVGVSRTAISAVGAALLTAFGGGTQSKVLHWAVERVAGNSARPFPQFPWQRAGPFLWVLIGVSAAALLRSTGWLAAFEEGPLTCLASINAGIVAGLAVVDSGWFPRRDEAPAEHQKYDPALVELLLQPHEHSSTYRFRAVSALGAFLYTSGGGIWRDILGMRWPTAFTPSYILPMMAGVFICRAIHELGDKRLTSGRCVFTLGVPATACLLAAFS